MCETKNAKQLRTRKKGDIATIGLAVGDSIDALVAIQKQLAAIQTQLREMPTRSEVREMINNSLQIHVESCDAARDDGKKTESNKFEFGLGKILGLKAEGRIGTFFGVLLWIVAGIIAGLSIPHVKAWLSAWAAR